MSGSQSSAWDRVRQVPRYSCISNLHVTYEGRSDEIATRPPDLSVRGMFINTTRTFPPRGGAERGLPADPHPSGSTHPL